MNINTNLNINNSQAKGNYLDPCLGKKPQAKYIAGRNLFNADLAGFNLSDLDLAHANLTNANLSDTNLTGTCFTEANLKSANLTGANLTGVNLNDARVEDAYFSNNVGINPTQKQYLLANGAILVD